jgi:glyoxylase-like metal-dependent hydrolase (beta-lactamase superfamily II)
MRCIPVFILAVSVVFAAIPAVAADSTLPFRVQRVSDRVLVFTELSPWESNHVVIVGADGLVLVDPGHTALMGRLIREAVADELGRDRFAYVIDTHGHWGHTWGNAAFPEALVIGHEQASRSIEGDRVTLERRTDFFLGQLEQTQLRLDELDPAGDEARDVLIERDHLDRIVRGLGESGFAVQPPRLTFSDRLTLDLGDLTLEMFFLGRGHSESDIAVMIPEEKVLLMGCFFLDRGPLPYFGTQPALDPRRWLEVFGAFLENEADLEHVILGQHSVWPRDRLVAMRDYMAELWSEITTVEAEGVDFETAMGRLSLQAEPDFFRQVGASEEDLDRYHRFEANALWRQLKDSAAAEVEQALNDGGPEAGLALYREIVAGNGADVYFDENEFNLLGYRFLGQERVDEAIAVFQINVDHFPDSWNVYDSLGEAYAVKGDTARAIELYRRSVELNPDNANGVQAIERLGAEVPAAGRE